MTVSNFDAVRRVLSGVAHGPVVAAAEALSFWGGVDPATSRVIDVHHPLHGVSLAGSILVMPTSRGSCSGSGVLLDMALNGRAPAALVFSDAEDVLTLGASVAAEMFGRPLPVLRATPTVFDVLARAKSLEISESSVAAEDLTIPIAPRDVDKLELTEADRGMLEGGCGPAVRQAMRILCAMAAQQGAQALVDVSQVHIDGCIYASAANLTFAERMAELEAGVRIPTTTNAISVDHDNWRSQGVPSSFGFPASRLADAYVRMGCRPTYTCSPYLLDSAPKAGEFVAGRNQTP